MIALWFGWSTGVDRKLERREVMSIKSIISAGTVLLLLGAVPSAYGQRDPQGDKGQAQPHGQQAAPKQPQASRPAQPAARPAPAAQRTQPAQPTARHAPTAQRTQPAYGGAYHGGVKPTATPTFGGVHPSGVPQQQSQVRSGFLQSRASSWTTQHRTWQQRGGYNGYRVPDDRFSLYFGSGHFFEIGNLPLLFVGGYPRFQYDGYWVTLMDPWPENWPPLWYETDNVYVDWGGDGYYLYDTNYPGIGIAVTISF
jgi:hypothetical protein